MKLIQSLDISEGISMDSLKPIIDSGAESSLDSCLAMKDSVVDDHKLKTEKHSQINSQKDKSLTDIAVESMGNNAKKMLEKVDLNSSNISVKKDTWNSETGCDKSSEKENISETNEERFDFISDDESESMHLEVSSGDESSLGEDDVEKKKSCEKDVSKKLHNSNLSENKASITNENSDNGGVQICSEDTETAAKVIVSKHKEDSNFEVKEGNELSQDLDAASLAPSRRKRNSQNCDESIGISSKRTKVSKNDNDDCDILFEDSSKKVIKNNTSTKEKLKDSAYKTKSEKHSEVVSADKDTEEMVVCDSVEEKDSVKSDKSKTDCRKDVRSDKSKIDATKDVTSDKTKIDSKKDLEKSGADKLNPLPFLRNFTRAQLQSMTRNDLEELVLQKICEAITERSVCGELRETAVSLDQKLKAWQKKCQQLTKQVKDLSLVLKRYGTDLQNKGPNAVPVKITRSVGLQVQIPGNSSGIVAWNQDDLSSRKGEKAPATSPSSAAATKPGASTVPKSPTPTSPATKIPANPPVSPKGVENAKVNLSANLLQNSQPPSGGVKVSQTKSPTTPTTTTTTSSSSKPSQKIVSSVNNRIKSTSDLQVIDLTDAEEKSKSVSSSGTTSSQSITTTSSTDSTSTVVSTINSSPISSVGCRSIRVVQHLSCTSTSPLLTQTVTTAVAGQRVAYYVPSASVPQRQLIISNPPVRPAGVVVSRQNSIPAIVLKPGPMVPVSAVSASNANIIRTSNVSNALQLATARPQPRATHYLQRIPVAAAAVQSTTVPSLTLSQHPAPLPPMPNSGPNNANWKLPPPKPDLKISKVPNRNQQGIVLSWNMTVSSEYEEIASYQLFAYQEGSAPPSTQLWKKVGDVKALPLPMACTLTQFMEGHKYHFAVRAVDIYARYGPFSSPGNIVLTRN